MLAKPSESLELSGSCLCSTLWAPCSKWPLRFKNPSRKRSQCSQSWSNRPLSHSCWQGEAGPVLLLWGWSPPTSLVLSGRRQPWHRARSPGPHHRAGGEQGVQPADRHADAALRRKVFGKRWTEPRRGDLRAQTAATTLQILVSARETDDLSVSNTALL